MTATVQCPACKATYRLAKLPDGTIHLRCPKCQTSFPISLDDPPAEPVPAAPPAASRTAAPPARPGPGRSAPAPRKDTSKGPPKGPSKGPVRHGPSVPAPARKRPHALYAGLGVLGIAVLVGLVALVYVITRSGPGSPETQVAQPSPAGPGGAAPGGTPAAAAPGAAVPAAPARAGPLVAAVEIPGLRDALAGVNQLDQIKYSGEVKDGVLELDLSDNPGLTRLEPLRGSPVSRLMIFGTGVEDLSPLAGAPLVELNAGRSRVKDLSPLARCPLESLNLLYAPVEDLSALKGKSLKKIDFELRTARRGVEVLKEMPSLREINGQASSEFWVGYDLRSAIHRANPEYQFQGDIRLREGKVEEVSLVACNVKDLSPLAKVPTLKRLTLYGMEVADLSPLKSLELESLDLSLVSLKTVEGVAGMKLSELNVSLNQDLADLSPLAGMPLTRLDLKDTAVSDLAPIKKLPELLYLDLRGTRVVNVAPLGGTSIIVLWIDKTKVNDLAPLKGLGLLLLSFEHDDLPRWPRGLDELQEIRTLRAVGRAPDRLIPAAEYWEILSKKGKAEGERPQLGDRLPVLAEPEAPKEKPTGKAIYARASQSLVTVKTDRGSGTGVCIGVEGLVLTSHQLIAGADPSEIRAVPFLYTGRKALQLPPVKARIMFESPEDDLAALRLDPVPVYLSPLPVAAASPPAGGTVFALAGPGPGAASPEESMTSGKVSAGPSGEGGPWLRHGSAVSAAGLGGPILNEFGQVVGIASGKPSPGPGVFLAVPVERIREIFKKQSG